MLTFGFGFGSKATDRIAIVAIRDVANCQTAWGAAWVAGRTSVASGRAAAPLSCLTAKLTVVRYLGAREGRASAGSAGRDFLSATAGRE